MSISLGTAALAAGISAAGSAGSAAIAGSFPTGFDYQQTSGLMEQQMTNQGKLNIQQFAINKAFQDYINEYNTPENQVQRYIDAGINPLYGVTSGQSGNANGATSSTGGSASLGSGGGRSSNAAAASVASGIQQAGDMLIKGVQQDLTLKELALKEKQINNEYYFQSNLLPYQQSALDAQARNAYVNATNQQNMLGYQMDLVRQQIMQGAANERLSNAQAKEALERSNWIAPLARMGLTEGKSRTSLNYSTAAYQNAMRNEVAPNAASQRALNFSQRNLNNWDSQLRGQDWRFGERNGPKGTQSPLVQPFINIIDRLTSNNENHNGHYKSYMDAYKGRNMSPYIYAE